MDFEICHVNFKEIYAITALLGLKINFKIKEFLYCYKI